MTSRLLVFGRFTDDSQGVLAGVQPLAFMCIELALKHCRSVLYGESFATSYSELLTAIGAYGEIWSRPDVLYDPHLALCHAHSLAHLEGRPWTCENQTAPLPTFGSVLTRCC
jgi:hypothetical protein